VPASPETFLGSLTKLIQRKHSGNLAPSERAERYIAAMDPKMDRLFTSSMGSLKRKEGLFKRSMTLDGIDDYKPYSGDHRHDRRFGLSGD
jgi:hypothetical protein